MESKKKIIKKLYCKRNPLIRFGYLLLAMYILYTIIFKSSTFPDETRLIGTIFLSILIPVTIYLAFFVENVGFNYFFKWLKKSYEQLPEYEFHEEFIIERIQNIKVYYNFFCGFKTDNKCTLLYIDRFIALPVFPDNFLNEKDWLQFNTSITGKVYKRSRIPNYGTGWKKVVEEFNNDIENFS